MTTTPAPADIVPHRWNWSISERTLTRRVRRSKHMIRQPEPAWSFDLDLLQELRPRFDRIVVAESETGFDYTVDAVVFDQHGIRCDRGFGLQKMLPVRFWSVSQREDSQLPLFAGVPS